MAVQPEDVIYIAELLKESDLIDAVKVASTIMQAISDRPDLHSRDPLERFIDLVLGEVAERAVYAWLRKNDKNTERVQKNYRGPDPGYDLIVKNPGREPITISVKSSVSVYKSEIPKILDTFTLAVTPAEAAKADAHVQVYYWLEPQAQIRTSVPSLSKAIIVAWALKNDLVKEDYTSYTSREQRRAPEKRLRELRPMQELLKHV